MPQVTVYIRKEDIKKWEGIDKKSEFIHNALNAEEPYDHEKVKKDIKKVSGVDDRILGEAKEKAIRGDEATAIMFNEIAKTPPKKKVSKHVAEVKKILEQKDIKTCKHGFAVGLCKYGCKR